MPADDVGRGPSTTKRRSQIPWYWYWDTGGDHGHERFQDAAPAGDAARTELYATEAGATVPPHRRIAIVTGWNRRSTVRGAGSSAV